MRFIPATILALAVAGPLFAGIGATAIQPPLPTSSDVITAVVIGELPDPCHPNPTGVVAVSGQNITINLSSNAPPGRICAQVITPFTTTVTVGRLAAGSYTITYRFLLDDRFLESTLFSFAVTPGCAYSLSSTGTVIEAAGGAGSVSVTTSAGCAWTVSGAPGWISGINPASSTGSGAVTYQVTRNTGGDRSATLTIAGLAYTVQQSKASTVLNVVGSMPQIASGGQWKTTITLINKGTTSATARLNFFDDAGNPLPLPLIFPQGPQPQGPVLTATIDRTVNPGAALVIESSRQDAGPALAGWAQLLSSGDISGFAVFSAQQGEAVVPVESRNADSYVLYFDGTAGSATGVALANTITQAVSVVATVRDDSGATVGSATIAVPAMGHTSFNLADQFSATAQKRGTLELKTAAPGQISALGLRFSPAGIFSAVPLLAK